MADKKTLKEKCDPWAVVGGGYQGIGEAFACQLASRGINLLIIWRREKPLKDLAERIVFVHGVEVRHFVFDLSEAGRISELEPLLVTTWT